MATSAVAAGKIQLAAARGEEIPTGWIIDSEGRQTTDPSNSARAARCCRSAAPRATRARGLAAMVEVLCGLLTGLGFGVEPTGRHNDGCFMAVFNVAAFRPLKDFKREVAEFARYLKATPPSEGSTGVFYPGEVEYIREQQRRRQVSKSRTPRGKSCGRWPATTNWPPSSIWHEISSGRHWENSMTRQMVMVGFLQAQNCTNLPSSWRHPDSRDDSMSADYYQEIGRILESGKFHMAFFDDRLAMPDRYGNDHAHTVEYGIRCVKMDPLVVLTCMGMATEKLGLGATASTTYFEPFDVARRFATLDLMSGGRAAWNVVTSLNDGEAHNMGKDAHLEHDFRYDRADEFMEVVLGHWDAWEDGSVIMDKKTGRFADPAKVKRLDHKGEFFKSRGPFTVPRSSQGHPVVIQAGASGRGQRFAGRWGEVIFTAARNVAAAKEGYAAVKNEAAKAGRDPDQMFLCNLTTPVCAATRAEAEDKMALINKLPLEIDALSLLAEALNYDFASKGLDEPLTSDELKSMQGILGIRDGVLKASGKSNPSARDFVTFSGRGQVHDAIVGGPKEIADRLEEMFVERGCDGFVIAATIVPGSYADFVKHVVPELQRRGLFRKDYAGKTLRENLGLKHPAAGAWKTQPRAAAE